LVRGKSSGLSQVFGILLQAEIERNSSGKTDSSSSFGDEAQPTRMPIAQAFANNKEWERALFLGAMTQTWHFKPSAKEIVLCAAENVALQPP
jgi:hypothetical protein